MLVTERVAVCEGCRHREPAEDENHPATWPRLELEHEASYYCSTTCMVHSLCAVRGLAQSVVPYGLSELDVQVLDQLGRGQSNREIADALHYSERMVKGRLRHIFEALNARYRLECALIAHKVGLINLNQLASVLPMPQLSRSA